MPTARFLPFLAALAAMTVAVPAQAQISATTQFMKAIKERDADKANALISAPGSIVLNSKDRDSGEGVLHMMVRDRDIVWMNWLLGRGAKPDIEDSRGLTPLALAAQIGWVEGADRLLRARATVDAPSKSGETPLILAVHNRDMSMVRLLLGKGADPKRPDSVTGKSALDHARTDGRSPAIVKMLEAPPAAAPKTQGPKL